MLLIQVNKMDLETVTNKSEILDFLKYAKTFIRISKLDLESISDKEARFLFIFACSKGRLDIAKLLYESRKYRESIDLKMSDSLIFNHSFATGYLWITDWLYNEAKKINNRYEIEKDLNKHVKKALDSNNYQHIRWLFEVLKTENIKVDTHFIRIHIDEAIQFKNTDKLIFLTELCKDYSLKDIDIIDIGKSCEKEHDFDVLNIIETAYYGR